MRRKVLSERQRRVLASIRFLDAVGRSTLPIGYTDQGDVERLLGLEAAGLVKAVFDPMARERSGEARIPRAVVLCVTQEGFATLARTERETPGILSRFEEQPPPRRARKSVPA